MRIILVTWCVLCIVACPLRVWALDVLVNQVGYEATAPKVVRAQRGSDYAGSGSFSVRRASDQSQVCAGTLTRKGPLWDKWYWEADFGSYQVPGDYYVQASVGTENASSYGFTIGTDVCRNQTGVLTYQYFWTQRCGVAVSGWHGLCHADDGLRKDTSQHVDAAGGWHDAGDYNKFAHGFTGDAVFALEWLYDADRSYFDGFDTNANGIADMLDEALQGGRWLAKMVQPSGHVLKETQKRRPGPTWVRPEADTNNVIGDWDDRWIEPGNEITPQEITVCAALIKMHRILQSKGLPTEDFANKALAVWNHRVALAIAEGGHNNLGSAAHHVWAGLGLHAVFGQQDCYDRALQRVAELASTAIANPSYYDSIGLAESPGWELGVLAWFARNYPGTYPADEAASAVQALMARYMVLADDPVGLVRRDEGGNLQYFPGDPDWDGFYLGINRLYLLVTWGAIEAHRAVGGAGYLRFAIDQYNWVMGANYNRVCMMEQAADFDLPRYHTRYDTIPGHESGAQPGVVPNGYVRIWATGYPYIDMSTKRYQTNEGWLINNAAYAMALSGMTVFRDQAEFVSDTIPTTMYAGQAYGVSVTMRNSGYTTWRSEDYRLGAVGDSDPFAAGRQDMAGGTTVGPGQSYTWTFVMTAPATPDTYTTDWRMVHENLCWFGDTLVRQVQVVLPPVTGDFDGDRDVDQEDFGHLQACFGGSGSLPPPGCEDADLQGDLDVDQDDSTIFEQCMGGANQTPGC